MNMHPSKMPKQVCAFLGLVGYGRKVIKNFAKIAKPLTLLAHQQAIFEWTPTHHKTLLTLKEAVIQAPILHYPNLKKCYIVYTDASNDTCGAQLFQEHDGKNSQQLSFHTHSLTLNINGAPQNKKPMMYIMQSPNRIITFMDLKL